MNTNIARNSFVCTVNGVQTTWSEETVKQKLQTVGCLNGKNIAWLQADLRITEPPHWLLKFGETVVGKYSFLVPKIYNANIRSPQHTLLQIRKQINPSSPLVLVFNRAVARFNQIAPRYSIPQLRVYTTPVIDNTKNVPIQVLSELIDFFTREAASRKSYEYISIICNREGYFQIKRALFKEIDSAFFISQKLVQQKLHHLHKSFISLDQSVQIRLLDNFDAYTLKKRQICTLKKLQLEEIIRFYDVKICCEQETRGFSYLNLIDICVQSIEALLEKMPETMHSEWIKEGLSYLFSEIDRTIDLQSQEYELYPENEKSKIQGKPHYQCLQEIIDKGIRLYQRAKERFPHHSMAIPGRYRLGVSYSLLDPLKSISKIIEASSIWSISQSFSHENRWAFLQPYPEEYFYALSQEIQPFKSVIQLSESLREACKGCTYVDMGELLNLACIRNGTSITELLPLFKNVKEMRVGDNVPDRFFEQGLLKAVVGMAKSLKYLDLSCSGVRDEDIQACCSASQLEEVNLSQTALDGSCLSSEMFKTVSRLYLQACRFIINERYLENLSCQALEVIDLSYTNITGSCLKANAFKRVKKLILRESKRVTDEHLKKFSSRKLEEITFINTNITGSCFSADAFKTVERLNIHSCRNMRDEYLKNLSSRVLKKVDLACTYINGSCLSGDGFKTVEEVDLCSCKNITDEHLKGFSSRVLKKADLSFTAINGSCLSADVFKTVEVLDLYNCENITDEHLKALSSTVLQEVYLAWMSINGKSLSSDAFKTVKKLCIAGCEHITDMHLGALSSVALEEICLACISINGSCLFSDPFRNAKIVNLNRCKNIKEEYVKMYKAKKPKGLYQINP